MQEMLWAALMEPAIWADDEKPKPVEHAPDWPWLGLWFANRGRDFELYSKIIVLSCLSCAQVSLWFFWILECSGLRSFCRLFWILEADFGSWAFQEARAKLGTSFGLLHNEAHGFHIHCTEAPEAHSIHAPSWLTLLASFLHLPSWAVVQTMPWQQLRWSMAWALLRHHSALFVRRHCADLLDHWWCGWYKHPSQLTTNWQAAVSSNQARSLEVTILSLSVSF